jgi:hypothetical protein
MTSPPSGSDGVPVNGGPFIEGSSMPMPSNSMWNDLSRFVDKNAVETESRLGEISDVLLDAREKISEAQKYIAEAQQNLAQLRKFVIGQVLVILVLLGLLMIIFLAFRL